MILGAQLPNTCNMTSTPFLRERNPVFCCYCCSSKVVILAQCGNELHLFCVGDDQERHGLIIEFPPYFCTLATSKKMPSAVLCMACVWIGMVWFTQGANCRGVCVGFHRFNLLQHLSPHKSDQCYFTNSPMDKLIFN